MKRFQSALASCMLAGCLLSTGANLAAADVRVGIHISAFPDLVPVPGYPVYYAPHVGANFFFYDGDYWLYDADGWYTSPWYDGPWEYVHPDFVPLYVLRVPVRYYRAPPSYFWGWHRDAPPRWGRYWGPQWEHKHSGWDHWDRHRVPRPAPLPSYQRGYERERYPDRQRQRELRDEHYGYRPQDGRAQHYREPARQPDRERNEPQRPENSSGGWQRADDRGSIQPDVIRDQGQRNSGRRNDLYEPRGQGQRDQEQRDQGRREQMQREPMRDASSRSRESFEQPRRMQPEQREQPSAATAEPRGNGRQMQERGGDDRGRGGNQGGRNNDGGRGHDR